MPPQIDYRQTFLRRHVPTELDPPFAQEPGFREEILALDSLRHRLLQTFPDAGAEIHRLASRRRFFLTMPDDEPWLYLPVRVRSLANDGKEYADLTDLLCSTAGSGRSVLLTARSGAGKSTAMLKAFFDCLVGREPVLGGRLPCYLRRLHSPRRAFVQARKNKAADHEMILDLLAEAARLPSPPSAEQLEHWLHYSPPLLLFLDLNAAPDDLRPVLAEAIMRFQEYFEGKHRWVIAYRSAGRDDTLLYLTQTGRFGAYDLRHLEYTDAEKYLGNLRRVEDGLKQELGRPDPQAANQPTPIDAVKLRELFQRYGNDPNGLISTPLLMHFVSVIGVERAAGVESLAQLYEEVVEDYLDRDYGSLKGKATTPYAEVVRRSGLTNPAGRTKIKTAMARAALAIMAAGSDTRLQPPDKKTSVEEVVDRLLGSPEDFRHPEWWPADPWWHDGRYYREAFDEPACRALREFSFLRRDGDAFGFLHDSFLYYFAALAIRCRKEPILAFSPLNAEPVRAEWCRKAVERMHLSPETWRLPALFLGGMLTPEELRALLPPLLTAEPATGWYGVVSQVVCGRRRPAGQEDLVLRHVERALRSRASELERYPEALFPHVYNHLSWCEEPQAACHAFADGVLRPAMNATGRPWLRAETPMPPLAEQVFRCDSEPRCLAAYAPEMFIAGHADGTVRRWRVDTGAFVILFRHLGVHSVAAYIRDGTVISGGADGTVRRWAPGRSDAEVLYRHEGAVASVAVDDWDGVVISGGADGTVRRLAPGWSDAEVVYRHTKDDKSQYENGVVYSVAVGGAGQRGDMGGTGRRGTPLGAGRSDAEVLYRHEREGAVVSVAVDAWDGAVISGGWDGSIRRWAPGQPAVVLHHCGCAAEVAHTRDGGIVFIGIDLSVWRLPLGAKEAIRLYKHEGRVTCMAADDWDGAVFSGGADGTIRRWLPGQDRPGFDYQRPKGVWCAAVDKDDGEVALGGEDGTVRSWVSESRCPILAHHEHGNLPESVDKTVVVAQWAGIIISGGRDGAVRRCILGHGENTLLYRHPDEVRSLVVDRWAGAVVSGGADGTIRRWLPGQSAIILYRHLGVLSVAVDGPSEAVISCGIDGTVRRWLPGQSANILYRHLGVLSVAVDARDGAVMSAGEDGTIRRLLLGGADAEILYRHEGRVRSVAVDESADCLFSGGHDANLRLFRLAARDFVMFLTPYSIRCVASSLRHNRIALALGDGRLVLVRVEPNVEAPLSYPAQRKNPPPDASSQ